MTLPKPQERPVAPLIRQRLEGAWPQLKPAVVAPDDALEHEADQVAEDVLRMPEPDGPPPRLQEVCTSCAETMRVGRGTARKVVGGSEVDRALLDAAEQAVGTKDAGRALSSESRRFFEPRFGVGFGDVRIHEGSGAAVSARRLNARAFTYASDIWLGEGERENDRHLLAHELVHILQQGSDAGRDRMLTDGEGRGPIATEQRSSALMRDLALEPPEQVPDQPELTPARIERALRYNRASYNEESTRLIQDLVGATPTGRFDEDTVRLVALIQRQFGLVPADGKVGPDTYDLLIRELQAEAVTGPACLTLFQLIGPQPLTFFRTSPTAGRIQSRFDIRARFDPRCNCGDYEYRQYIAGHVELLEAAQPGVTPPATSGCASLISAAAGVWAWNFDGCFQIPGGGLSRSMREDGDVAIPVGVAGRRYGHRSARPHPTDRRDRYLPDRPTGCVYQAFDVPEIAPVPAAPGDIGDVYDWEMRFRGLIRRTSDGTIVADKWWSIIDTVSVV